MALKLRKKDKSDNLSEEAASQAPIEEAEPGKPAVPNASYNMMTVRYAADQRKGLTTIVLMGIIAVIVVLVVGRWLGVKSAEADAHNQIASSEDQIAQLNVQINGISETGGLTTEAVNTLLDDRVTAFAFAVGPEIDYARIMSDLTRLDTSSAWYTGFQVSPGTAGSAATLQVTGRAINPLDVSDWYDVFDAEIEYATPTDTWPQFSGTPGDPTGQILWTSSSTLSDDVYTDRTTRYGLEIPIEILRPVQEAPPEEGAEGEEATTEEGA